MDMYPFITTGAPIALRAGPEGRAAGAARVVAEPMVPPSQSPESALSVRRALRVLLGRLMSGGPEAACGRAEERADGGPCLSTRFENSVRRLRANAHAAYSSVEGPQSAALDAALRVVEAEWRAALAQRDGYAEALKSIRLYAREREARLLAERALAERAVFAGSRDHQAGSSRYPFEHELAG
jgi:hypothetical protein